MSRFFTSGDPPEPLPPIERQRLDGWIRMLDVDLELAQRTLRLPTSQLPLPPIALPPLVVDGVEVAPAVEAAAPGEPLEPPKPVTGLRGAYARRAAKQSPAHGSVTPVSNHSD